MTLKKMTEDEYQQWAKRSIRNYAKDKKDANNLTDEEAHQIAISDFSKYLPEGKDSKGHFLFTLRNDEDEILGYLWIGPMGTPENLKVFVYDIIIEEPHRRKGYGRQAMLLAEDQAKAIGAKEIGLHVFGFNTAAIQLYKGLGYQTTDLVMAKKL